MNFMECGGSPCGICPAEKPKIPLADRPLHRLAQIRQREGISRRTIARRLELEVADVKKQEKANADLLLSHLYQWQEVLDVPIAELLVETGDPLSKPVLKRARLVRLMKTARTILQRAQQTSIRRMAQVMIDQLLELMPELETVTPWHAVGQRRTRAELGQAAERHLSFDWFRAPVE